VERGVKELSSLDFHYPDEPAPNVGAAPRRKCLHPRRDRRPLEDGGTACGRCGATIDPAKARAGRNNRKRGNAAELTSARVVGGRKMGPLGLPWDVEMPGYARLQVRKYATPESLRKIAAELDRIGSGAEMPGYIWIEPGRGGERLIVFRLADFAERHGIPSEPVEEVA
jgi:hypothetical protein